MVAVREDVTARVGSGRARTTGGVTVQSSANTGQSPSTQKGSPGTVPFRKTCSFERTKAEYTRVVTEKSSQLKSGRFSNIPVVEPADLRELDDPAQVGPMDRPRLRRVTL
jgi:hypothetical protein